MASRLLAWKFVLTALILKAEGGYTGQEHNVVMCACSPREIELVESAVKEADPAAFTVILESSEILGYGFPNLKVAEHETAAKAVKP